ncbi:MAG: HAMP domain-containing sensor histidine kinase [Candidatus Acidiferrales bacterium]|jgi:signal transduction histidine kinase
MKRNSELVWSVTAAWLVLLGGYATAVVLIPAGISRNAFVDIFLCVLPFIVNGALLLNAITPDWRKNAFWMLLAFGSSLWMVGQAIWTYIEIYDRHDILYPFIADIVFFLHTVPMIAALTMQPQKDPDDRKMLYGYVDFGLMLCWWMYLYVFVVVPWQYVVVDRARYVSSYDAISTVENLVFIGSAAFLALRTRGYWRKIYLHLAGAGAVYAFGTLAFGLLVHRNVHSGSSLSSFPPLISFLWLGTAGIIAFHSRGEENNTPGQSAIENPISNKPANESVWASRMARAALLSLPIIGFWCLELSQAPMAVHTFRILLTLGAVLPLGSLAFLRHELVDAERLRLLRASQESIDNLKRLQMQFVQSEKLASIGQLVGGAAHEINNPLTAILGYSELLADDPSADARSRGLAEKIREQARRTKSLVNNLLSFARQAPSEQRSSLDINMIVNSSVQFRRVDLRGKNIRIDVQTDTTIPQVRGDANQLLQVFFNIINNAVDAMQEVGGGTLTVRTLYERGNVTIIFSDTGPGIREPKLVFDPFYTTKPVGKGTGLGLSICYGLVHDQGGQISCENRPEGGATFRVELPAVPTLSPLRAIGPASRGNPAKLA